MQTIKPFALGLQTRCIEYRRRIGMSITAAVYFPFAAAGEGCAWTEMSMWSFLAKEMPAGPLIDEGVVKLRSEYLLHAHAHPPGGRATQCGVRARVGKLHKSLQVSGMRYWRGRKASEPLPFDSLPLDWAHAYGGAGFADNPLGIGRELVEHQGERLRPLPQLELPAQRMSQPQQTPAPAAFGLIDLSWPQRAQYRGTYDAAWLQEHSPGFAGDLDWRFFNLAPSDQWFDEMPAGDESFEFEHMHPHKPLVGGHLPGLRARCFVNYGSATRPVLREVPMRLSTLWFFPHAERGIVLFQGLAQCVEDDAGDISLLMGALERIGEAKPDEHYAKALAQRLDPDMGAVHALRDSDLLPAGIKGSDPDFEAIQTDYRSEGLLGQAQRRGALLKIQLARDEAAAKGVDPDRLGLKLPVAEALPTLEELPDYLARKRAEALNAQVTALLDAAEQGARAREQMKQAGIDVPVPRGPPRYRAAEHLASIQALLPAAAPGRGHAPALDLAALRPKLLQVEALERVAYLAAAHTQAAAPPMTGARAAAVREAVIAAHRRGQSFFGADLTGADLSGLDLSGADFSGAWLESANFEGSFLKGSLFTYAVLAHANLGAVDATGADFEAANLGKARLSTARLVNAKLAGVNLCDTALAQTDFRGANMDGARLLGATFGLADWRNIHASGLVFLKARLSKMVLRGARLAQPQFIECDLSEADLTSARLDRPAFIQCRGTSTRFTRAELSEAVFVQDCDFSNADFSHARLSGSNLRGTVLRQANFSHALLERCDLSHADLSHADLRASNARGALLIKTCLQGARMAQSNLMDWHRAARRPARHRPGRIEPVCRRPVAGAHRRGHAFRRLADAARADPPPARRCPRQPNCTMNAVADLSPAQRIVLKAHYGEPIAELALAEIPLAGQPLPGAIFHKVNLTRADFRGADLRDAVFDECQLAQADFSQAVLRGAVFNQCRSPASRWQGALLRNARLVQCELQGACLVEADLNLAAMVKCRLDDADLSGAIFDRCTWSEVAAPRARIERSAMYQFTLHKCTLDQASLAESTLHLVVFTETPLPKRSFVGLQLNGCQFMGCELSAADFSGARMPQCNFKDSTLHRSTFCARACRERVVSRRGRRWLRFHRRRAEAGDLHRVEMATRPLRPGTAASSLLQRCRAARLFAARLRAELRRLCSRADRGLRFSRRHALAYQPAPGARPWRTVQRPRTRA